MQPVTRYRYFKRSADEHSPPEEIVRGVGESVSRLEMWWAGAWVESIDCWTELQSENVYWEISERQALKSLSALTKRHGEQESSLGVGLERPDVFPLSSLTTGAIALHELFLSLSQAGFTEKQALDIIVGVITEARNPEEDQS